MRGEDNTDAERTYAGGRPPPTDWRPSSTDYVFEALNARRRRTICRILQATADREIEDLAMAVATQESAADDRPVTNHEWETVFASLYHSHIPKLDDMGVVRFDRATGVVNPGPRFEQVVAVLSAVEDVLAGDADD